MSPLFKRVFMLFFLLLGLFCALNAANAVPSPPQVPVSISQNRQSPALYQVSLRIPQGWHLYAPGSPAGWPLVFQPENPQDHVVIDWPAGKKVTQHGEEVYVYDGSVEIPFHLEKASYVAGKLVGGICKDLCVPFEAAVKFGQPPPLFQEAAWAVFLAFIGGLFLNVMPCVWPVLFAKIKAIGTKKNEKGAWRHLLATFLGILTFFNAIAMLAFGADEISEAYLWGAHFQSTGFLCFLVGVIGLAGLAYILPNRVFSPLQTFANNLLPKNASLGRDYVLGLLAGLLASPCTAPFLTAALAFSMAQGVVYSSGISLLIFNAIALGYGAPYLLLLASPKMLCWVPRPGRWMMLLEKISGIMFLVLALWLGWSVYRSIGAGPGPGHRIQTDHFAFQTRPLDAANIPELLAQGKKVLVITTAPWCLTCLYNERTVFSSQAVVKALSQPDWVVMVGVWENNNAQVESFLKKVKSPGVPTYRVYGKQNPDGVGLSEILSVSHVLKAMDEAK